MTQNIVQVCQRQDTGGEPWIDLLEKNAVEDCHCAKSCCLEAFGVYQNSSLQTALKRFQQGRSRCRKTVRYSTVLWGFSSRFILMGTSSLAIAAIVAVLGFMLSSSLGLLLFIIVAYIAYFFRDPERVVAPARWTCHCRSRWAGVDD